MSPNTYKKFEAGEMEVDDHADVDMDNRPQVGAGDGDHSNDNNHFDKVDVPQGVAIPRILLRPSTSFEDDPGAVRGYLACAFVSLVDQLKQYDKSHKYIESWDDVKVSVASMDLEELGRLWNAFSTEGLGVLVARLRLPEAGYVDVKKQRVTQALREGYYKPFLGSADETFFHYLSNTKDITSRYARALSIVQSSGSGKSRMMTQLAEKVFTLPICIRNPAEAGYPPSDSDVFYYFKDYMNMKDQRRVSSHAALACFFAAAYGRMYKWLSAFHTATHASGETLHKYWFGIMELREPEGERERFFQEVVNTAKVYEGRVPSSLKTSQDDFLRKVRSFYDLIEHESKRLVEFLGEVAPAQSTIFITYIDEVHELGQSYWSLLRLLNYQPRHLYMWYLFAGIETNFSHYAPDLEKRSYLSLSEIQTLIPPYFALGFDQNIIATPTLPLTLGELCSMKHLARYGRPLWSALMDTAIDLIDFASPKLTGGISGLEITSPDIVFAVLSQRISLNSSVTNPKALKLAERGVADHMRLLKDISESHEVFYTASPSEPILALTAAYYMYQPHIRLEKILNTLSHSLCEPRLMKRGILGELAARFLLLIARDYTSHPPRKPGKYDLLRPVRLLDFLDTLFGNDEWRRKVAAQLTADFGSTYINFTHWMVFGEPLPVEDNRLLFSNLWARGAALQCRLNQDAIDCVIPTYNGPVSPESIYDAEHISIMKIQIQLTRAASTETEFKLRSAKTFQDDPEPYPYIALLINFREDSSLPTGGNIQVVLPPAQASYDALRQKWLDADNAVLSQKRLGLSSPEKEAARMRKAEVQRDMNAFNRYLISVRGAQPSIYGILRTAKIEDAFDTFMEIVAPEPPPETILLQHAQPCKYLTGSYLDWCKEP